MKPGTLITIICVALSNVAAVWFYMTTNEVNDLEAMGLIIFFAASIGLVCTCVVKRRDPTMEDRKSNH